MNNNRRIKFQNSELIFGSLLVLGFLVIAFMAPTIAPPKGDFPELPFVIPRDGYKDIPLPPNSDHPFGTLANQYDVFYGLIWGTRRAFLVGISITLGRTFIGLLLGLISGYYKGFTSNLLMRITDAFMSMPSIAAAALMFALFGEITFSWGAIYIDPATSFLNDNRNLFIIILSLIVFGWMQYARLIRANVISEREKEYVQAARAVGSPPRRIIFKHVLPNVTKGLYVLVASDIGGMVAIVSLFYFIGLIGNSPYGLIADWGEILNASRDWIIGTPSTPFLYWYTYVPAISAVALFTIGWSMVGDGLRNYLDPRISLRRRKREEDKKFKLTEQLRKLAGGKPQSPVPQPKYNLSFEKSLESDLDSVLAHARDALARDELFEALDIYTHLVWSGKNIDQIIQDLQGVARQHPKVPLTWHVLGDALMQAGRKEKAQQAFDQSFKVMENGKAAHQNATFLGNLGATWKKGPTGKLTILGLPALMFGLVYIALWLIDGMYAGANAPVPTLVAITGADLSVPVSTPPATPLPSPSKPATVTMESSPMPTLSTDTPLPPGEVPAQITSCVPDNPSQTGRAVDIIDGNTIKVFMDDKVYVVRYIGIDVPAYGEVNEPYGQEAAFKNADLVFSKEIVLIPDITDKDPVGRLLRYVLVGDTFVNYELLEQGFATVLDLPPNSACAGLFQQAEQEAIANHAGRWLSSSPTSSP